MSIFRLLFLLMAFSTVACAQDETQMPVDAVRSDNLLDNPYTEVVIEDGVDFAFDVFRSMQKGKEGNFVFSPYAISSAMAMVYNGTAEETQRQMSKALHFRVKLWYLNEAFSWLSERYAYRPQETGSDILLSLSNALWLQRGIELKPSFKEMIEAFYLSPIRFSNFALYPVIARSDINSWIRERTKGKISQLFEPSELSKDTRMILISATYLRAKWANQFDPRVTRGVPFFPTPGKTIIVPTMVKASIFSYFDSPEFSIIELPYSSRRTGSKKLSMMVLLPKETFGLSKLTEKMTGANFQSAWNLMRPTSVIVTIPKFSLNDSYTMNGIFAAMGVTSLFRPGAVLTEMTDDTTLYLDAFYHRASVANDEAGSEAGNPYSVGLPPLGSDFISNPNLFTADHPFLFAIVDGETRSVLFMGRVSYP